MKPYIYILGPCGIDSESMYLETGANLYNLMKGRNWFYKSSFSKENRTSLHGAKGVGIDRAIEVFKEIKRRFPDIKLVTDVHETWQVEKLAGLIDCIQVPSMLSRQSGLIIECAKHFNIVFVKKMQFLGPNNVCKSVDKIKETNPNCQAWLGERGTAFGYEKLIVDLTIVDEIKKCYDAFLWDTTHSIQRSRSVYKTQGDISIAKKYFTAAPIFGYDGVFAEVHPYPPDSCSDKECQFYLSDFPKILKRQDEVRKLC